ncbi:TnsA endonuclease N-terminal domain-containing protein [Alcanivorax sp.]|uniref:TnsA endonuclease N-terminal domain-containing protein n=1 Tax=Alcanivorax sp. TaxID=1872427 RepID=UPI003A8CCF46
MHHDRSGRAHSPKIRPETELVPQQHNAGKQFQIATNLSHQQFPKHAADSSECHSPAEYLYCCLLEADPEVTHFVPQPFRLWVGNRRYTPDFYVRRRSGPAQVIEVKPASAIPVQDQEPLERFFRREGMQFSAVSNEQIFEREPEARHWLHIIQVLMRFKSLETRHREQDILEQLLAGHDVTVGDVLPPQESVPSPVTEVALFRLLHQGVITADLRIEPLNVDTVLSYENSLA